MRKVLVLASLAALAACGDNWHGSGGGGDDGGTTIDAHMIDAAAPPDAFVCAARAVGEIGGPCTTASDCDSSPGAGDGSCLINAQGSSVWPPEGYCFIAGSGSNCTNDTDCPPNDVCANVNDFGTFKVCMPDCTCGGTATSACPANQECANSFNGFTLDKNACVPGTQGVHDGDACLGFYQCDTFSACFNDAEYPGGQCTRAGCTLGDDTTCHGGTCVAFDTPPDNGNFCVDTCNSDTDCRQAEGYTCFDPGNGGAKYCRHPQVGDACTSAADCGGTGWTCQTGVTFPGGYCTFSGSCPTPGSLASCSAGSVCYDDLGTNYCVDRCNTIGVQDICRTGYVCADTDPSATVTTLGCVHL